MSATSLDIKLTDSVERELIARAEARPEGAPLLTPLLASAQRLLQAVLEGIQSARAIPAKGDLQ